jgi:poly-gamma-glutamate capsule biosynthesis protein CapA/YwtB (metallophosphatase superfamily)
VSLAAQPAPRGRPSVRLLRLALAGQALLRRPLARIDPGLSALFGGVDLALANLEGVIAPFGVGWPMRTGTVHVAPPEALDSLSQLGLRGLSLAGNHAFDLGPPGILSTMTEVARGSFLWAGVGADATTAARPGLGRSSLESIALVAMTSAAEPANAHAVDAVDDLPGRPGVNPLRVHEALVLPEADLQRINRVMQQSGLADRAAQRDRIVATSRATTDVQLLGATLRSGAPAWIQAADRGDIERNLATIRAASAAGRTVIAHVHQHYWGADWHVAPDWLRGFARQCLAAGAAIFVGHGPPVTMGHEWIDGRLALYGLGNLVFHSGKPERYPPEVWRGRVALVTVDTERARVVGLSWHAVRLEEGYPVLVGQTDEPEHGAV